MGFGVSGPAVQLRVPGAGGVSGLQSLHNAPPKHTEPRRRRVSVLGEIGWQAKVMTAASTCLSGLAALSSLVGLGFREIMG